MDDTKASATARTIHEQLADIDATVKAIKVKGDAIAGITMAIARKLLTPEEFAETGHDASRTTT